MAANINDLDIPESGAVFTYGRRSYEDSLPEKFWIRNDPIVELSCGDEHAAIVTESGRLFVFGSNNWGQLGVGSVSHTVTKPTCVKSLKTESIRLVACGRCHTVAASASGFLYSFGANGEGQLGLGDKKARDQPTQIPNFCEQLRMISAGNEHSVVLTASGIVFVFGGGNEGQLGLGQLQEVLLPTQLIMKDTPFISAIACGYYHTAMLTDAGKLYTFGEKDGGKLGLEGSQMRDTHTPQIVETIAEPVTDVSCGGNHTIALTASGAVHTFGEGMNGQLGQGTTLLQTAQPQPVKKLAASRIKMVACGENHSAALSETGKLYMFGDGRNGKLGVGDVNSNQFTPIVVKQLKHLNVQKVACGGCHTLVLARRKGDAVLSSAEETEDVVTFPYSVDDPRARRRKRTQNKVPPPNILSERRPEQNAHVRSEGNAGDHISIHDGWGDNISSTTPTDELLLKLDKMNSDDAVQINQQINGGAVKTQSTTDESAVSQSAPSTVGGLSAETAETDSGSGASKENRKRGKFLKRLLGLQGRSSEILRKSNKNKISQDSNEQGDTVEPLIATDTKQSKACSIL